MVANAAYPLMAGGRCGATMFAAEIHSGASGAADHGMGIQPAITALV